MFSALTFAATPLSNATQKTLPAFVGRSKLLIVNPNILREEYAQVSGPRTEPGAICQNVWPLRAKRLAAERKSIQSGL